MGVMETWKVEDVWPYGAPFVFLQVQLRMDSSIPLLTPFISCSKWKLKMIAYMKRQDLYDLSIALGKYSYENEND